MAAGVFPPCTDTNHSDVINSWVQFILLLLG